MRRSIVDWDCSKIQTLLETLKILNQLRGEFCVSSEVIHSFPQVGCVRNKNSVFHSSTESEANSLDAGLRMDGIPAHDFWDLVKEVLHSSNNVPARRNLLRDEIRSKQKKHPNRVSPEEHAKF